MSKRNISWLLSALTGACILAGCAVPPAAEQTFCYPPAPMEGTNGYFAIAENGHAKCCLVTPVASTVEERDASRMLQTYLKLATGADFAIYPEDNLPAGLARIHIGETALGRATPLDLPALQYGRVQLPNGNGYLIKTISTNDLIIRGATSRANILGVVGLLKRYVGIRRYWPGEPGGIGDVVPKRADMKLPQLEWRDWPYFISRIMGGLDERGPRPSDRLLPSFENFWRMNYTIPSNESYYRLLNAWDRTNEPNIFPLIDGKRFVPRCKPDDHGAWAANWQPCVSNPKVAEIMADSIKKYFRANPDKFALNLAVNDGGGDCTCDKCRAMDAPGADPVRWIGLCDRYIKFDNRVAAMVAKEFPGKILAFLAYIEMNNPPTTVKLHPMLMPVLCDTDNFFHAWDKWRKMGAENMGVYWYHDDMGFIMPKLDIHQSARRIRYVVESGLARSFYQEFYGIYPLDGMVGYVEQELAWDPRLNEDDLLNEYYRLFYGPAGQAMKSFYELLEADYNVWLAKAGKPHPYGLDISSIVYRNDIEQFAVLTVPAALKAQACLDAALASAKDQPVVHERIKLVKTLFDFAALGSRMYWGAELLRAAKVESLADAERIVTGAREVVDTSLALADYKSDVIEKPEIKVYEDHGEWDTFYNNLEKGSVHAHTLQMITMALGKAAEFSSRAMGADKAVAWWQTQAAKETRPVLKSRMQVVAFDASGRKIENLVQDPGFEERGAKILGGSAPDKDGHLEHGGAHVWYSGNTSMRCALTNEDAHTGKYSFVFWQTQHAGVSEYIIDPSAGNILRMSVWVKHNDAKGDYIVQTDPRRTGNIHLARTTVKVPWKPGEWQKIEVLVTIEPDTRSINLWMFVSGQEPGAKIWVDDFFIGKYPQTF